jgi:hypothetical protein
VSAIGRRVDISVAQLLALKEIVVPAWSVPYPLSRRPHPPMNRHPRDVSCAVPIVSISDTPRFCDERLADKIIGMSLIAAEPWDDLWLFRFSATETNSALFRAHSETFSWVVPVDLGEFVGLRCEFLGRVAAYFHILCRDHALMRWLFLLRERANKGADHVNAQHVEAAWHTAATEWYNMSDLLVLWGNSRSVPPELKPPSENGSLLSFRCGELVSRQTVTHDPI